jgi:transposase
MRQADLVKNTSKWVEDSLSGFEILIKGDVSAKKRASLFNRLKTILNQAAKVSNNFSSIDAASKKEMKALKARNSFLEAKPLFSVQPSTCRQDIQGDSPFSEPTPQGLPTEINVLKEALEASNKENQALKADNNSLKALNKSLMADYKALSLKFSKQGSNLLEAQNTIAGQKVELEIARERIIALETKQAAPSLNSGNSHKPSSTDMGGSPTRKRARKKGPKRNQGGQKGRKRAIRPKFKKEDLDLNNGDTWVEIHPQKKTCSCGEELVEAPEYDIQYDQVEVEIKVHKFVTVEKACICPECQKVVRGEAPKEIKNQGYVGAGFAAFLAVLNTVCCVSLRKLQNLLESTAGYYLSLGQINKVLKSVSMAVRPSYEELQEHVPTSPALNVDETRHRHRTKKLSVWVFVAKLFVFFQIGTRSSYMLEKILGMKFIGVLISDYYSAYHKYGKLNLNVIHSFCNSHLLRDAINCSEYLIASVSDFGEKLVFYLWEMFHYLNEREELEDKTSAQYMYLTNKLHELKKEITIHCQNAPEIGKAKGIRIRFLLGADESGYFRFIDNPYAQITNNAAEREIRTAVISRKINLGTQGASGRIHQQVMWTAWRTLNINGKSLFQFLVDSQKAYHSGQETPSLVNLEKTVPLDYRELALSNTKAEVKEDAIAKAEEAKARAEKQALKEAAEEAKRAKVKAKINKLAA